MTSTTDYAPLPHFPLDEPEENPIKQRLRGRATWLIERGRIKDAELMRDAAAALDMRDAALSVSPSQESPTKGVA